MRDRSRLIFECAAILLFALAIWFRAFWPVPMGLPDNGDFPKVLGRVNAWPAKNYEGQKFDYLVTDYVIDSGRYWDSQLPTFELLLARWAKSIAVLILPKGHFDLRILGTLHALILIIAFGLLMWTLRSHPWTWGMPANRSPERAPRHQRLDGTLARFCMRFGWR